MELQQIHLETNKVICINTVTSSFILNEVKLTDGDTYDTSTHSFQNTDSP